jgi:hypothetical protein
VIIAQRRGKKIATIAIARKLLTRAWHLLDQMQPLMPARRASGLKGAGIRLTAFPCGVVQVTTHCSPVSTTSNRNGMPDT